jgi:hypothetical protein
VNPTDEEAVACGVELTEPPGIEFRFQATDPRTNDPVGEPNTLGRIPPGGAQTYVIQAMSPGTLEPTVVKLAFACAGLPSAPSIPGVNTLLLGVSATPVPDIVALAASEGGIVTVPRDRGIGVFAVATVSLGAPGDITASADTGDARIPVTLLVCETDPVTGVCGADPGAAVSRAVGPGETPTFGVFVIGAGAVAFDPAVNRVFVRFRDARGIIRGATSVAVRTE